MQQVETDRQSYTDIIASVPFSDGNIILIVQ